MTKRILISLLCVLLLLTGLAGCKKTPDDDDDTTTSGFSDDFEALMDGALELDDLSDAQKRKLAEEGAERGYVVTFDNGLTVSDDNGRVILRQAEDGAVYDGYGNQIVVGSAWPDNEFTRQVPNPMIETSSTTFNAQGFNSQLDEMDKAAAEAYAKKLREAGFTIDIPTDFLYSKAVEVNAKNAAGYIVEFFWANGGADLKVHK